MNSLSEISPQISEQAPAVTAFPPLPRLRPLIYSFDRQEVDTTGSVWRIRASKDGGTLLSLNFDVLGNVRDWRVPSRTVDIAKLYIASTIARRKGKTAVGALSAIRSYFLWYANQHSSWSKKDREIAWHRMDDNDFVAFKVYQEANSGNAGNDFAILRQMYDWGAFGLQLPDFDVYQAIYLASVRARGNVKGAAVRGHDVLKGPLDSDEQRLVREAVSQGAGADQDRTLVMLHYELGLNPNATARMQDDDLKRFESKIVAADGSSHTEVYYQLAVPRVKKRTEHREVKVRPISNELGDLLSAQPALNTTSDGRLIHWLRKDAPESGVGEAMSRWSRKAGLISPRTREILKLNPRRFRYTLATEMARQGASRQKIAEVLDHTDLQNVEVYIEAASYVADQVAEHLTPRLDPFLRRFKGQVVARDKNPFPGLPKRLVPGAVVQLPSLPVLVGGVGYCGKDVRKDGLCGLAPPLTCYACDKFAAFEDAPHGEIADALEAIVEDGAEDADIRIPLQLTEAVQAIRQLQVQLAQDSILEEGVMA